MTELGQFCKPLLQKRENIFRSPRLVEKRAVGFSANSTTQLSVWSPVRRLPDGSEDARSLKFRPAVAGRYSEQFHL